MAKLTSFWPATTDRAWVGLGLASAVMVGYVLGQWHGQYACRHIYKRPCASPSSTRTSRSRPSGQWADNLRQARMNGAPAGRLFCVSTFQIVGPNLARRAG